MKKERDVNFFIPDRSTWTSEFVPEPFRDLDIFDILTEESLPAPVHGALEDYVTHLHAGGRRSLLLYGDPGVGKTRIASAIWNSITPNVGERSQLRDVVSAGTADNIVWATGMELPEIIKSGKPISKYHVNTAYFAVLDDLDKCNAGGWSSGMLDVLDARLSGRRLPTVMTMNLTPRQFVAKYGEAGAPMFNRLQRTGALVIRVQGQHKHTGAM